MRGPADHSRHQNCRLKTCRQSPSHREDTSSERRSHLHPRSTRIFKWPQLVVCWHTPRLMPSATHVPWKIVDHHPTTPLHFTLLLSQELVDRV
ncbi:hypothetical protein RSAG8_04757, partial [Rhizoctonia solani AG-8 WAC10335]